MTLDEVYQAALEAGSGGIRWNSETAWIQIRSTEGQDNWIDWRRFDPNAQFHYIASRAGTGAFNYTFQYTGMYILQGSGGQSGGLTNLTTNGSTRLALVDNSTLGCFVIITAAGQNISFNQVGSYTPAFILVYIGSYENANLINQASGGNSSKSSLSVSGVNDRVLVGTSGGTSVGVINYNCTTENQYSDSRRVCCCSLLGDESADAFITVNSGGNGTGSSSFVTEIQVF